MELVKIEENRNNLVNKHQEIIHNARYRLSELGIKVVSVLISMIRVSDSEFHQYAIKISDFKELIGSDSKKTYEYTHKMISELMKHPMHIGDEQFNWISYGKYEKGDNLVVFEIHRALKPYLLELQGNFLQYNIANILRLRSGYVIRLYELCRDYWAEGTRYKKSVKSVSFELKIDRMRELFEIPASYLYKDIRVNIIDKAVKQLKERTDIQITYKEQKIGRKVDRLIITVRENNKGSNDFLSSRKAFIAYIRQAYRPNPSADNYPTIFRTDTVEIKIDINGKLYAIENGTLKDLTKEKANTWWDFLYEKALTKELPIQQTLF